MSKQQNSKKRSLAATIPSVVTNVKKQPKQQLIETVEDNDTLLWLRSSGKQSAKEAPPLIDSSNLLQTLLHPLDKDVFTESVLHKRACAITGFGKHRVQEILQNYFCEGDPERLISDTASEDGISCWIPSANGIESFKVADQNMSLSLFRNSGASLYMRAPKETCEELTTALFRDLEMPLGLYPDGGSRGEVEVFLASKKSKRTPTHTDFQENFTIQLLGKKKWRLRQGDIHNPLRAKSPHFANTPMSVIETQLLASSACGGSTQMDPPRDDDERWVEVELDEGDILYHPPGLWHNVQALEVSSDEGVCLNINISLVTPTWADIISSAVRQLLWQSPLLRRPVAIMDMPSITGELTRMGFKFGPVLSTDCLIPPEMQRMNAFAVKQTDDEDEEEDEVNSHVIEWPSERTLDIDYVTNAKFERNPLSLVMFDFDANFVEDGDAEDTFNMIVSSNIGSTDLEPVARFEVCDIPLGLKPVLLALRSASGALSISEFRKTMTNNLASGKKNTEQYEWKVCIDVLIRCGWFVVK